jgi:pheromone shutdown-related protein TraB
LSAVLAEQPSARITRDGVEYFLLGTAHVSKQSVLAVQAEIASGQYDTVAVELCEARFKALNDPNALLKLDLGQVIRQGRVWLVAANLALSAFQRRIAEKFGIEPGAELKQAIDLAQKQSLKIKLIDRDIGSTLKRTQANLGFWKRSQLLTGLALTVTTNEDVEEADIEKLKQGDILESTFTEFASSSPEIYTPLIAERDRFMAAKLRSIGMLQEGKSVLAVVGAGHLKGIESYLREDHTPPHEVIDSLSQNPEPTWFGKAWPWLLLAVVLGGFAYGFAQNPGVGFEQILTWIMFTGGAAALGTAVALGHPLTILAALICAPFTTLHPAIGIGMVTALVQLWIRKPTVADLQQLHKDVGSLKGWYQNKAAHVLLVFICSNLFTILGQGLGIATIFKQLF